MRARRSEGKNDRKCLITEAVDGMMPSFVEGILYVP